MSCGVFGIQKHREIYHKSNHSMLILVKTLVKLYKEKIVFISKHYQSCLETLRNSNTNWQGIRDSYMQGKNFSV